jgi:hypothetical protein
MIMTHTMSQNWEKRHWCGHGGLHGLDKVPSLRWWCTYYWNFLYEDSFILQRGNINGGLLKQRTKCMAH